MSVILSQNDNEEQQGEPATGMTLSGGELHLTSSLAASEELTLAGDSGITVSAGGSLVVSEHPSPAEMQRIRSAMSEIEREHPSPAEMQRIRSAMSEVQGALPSPAEAEHLRNWYTAANKQVDVQRLLAVGEVTGALKPPKLMPGDMAGLGASALRMGELEREVNAMISLGNMAAGSRTLAEAAKLQHSRLLAGGIATSRQIFTAELASAAQAQVDRFVDTISSQVLAPTLIETAGAIQRMLEPASMAAMERVSELFQSAAMAAYGSSMAQFDASAILSSMSGGLALTDINRELLAGMGSSMAQFDAQQRSIEAILDSLAYTGRGGALPYTYDNAWAEPSRPTARRIEPADWQEALEMVITTAIKEGKATQREVIELASRLFRQQRSGQKPPEWGEIETVALMYKERGHRYDTQDAFVGMLRDKGMPISLSTFKRWIALYEQTTGDLLRPGKGSRRRGKL